MKFLKYIMVPLLFSTSANAADIPQSIQILSGAFAQCTAQTAMMVEENTKLKAQIAQMEKDKQEKPK